MSEIKAIQKLINDLKFTEEEKDALRKYFTGNVNRKNDALTFLTDLTTDEEKCEYMRSLISQPEQPGAGKRLASPSVEPREPKKGKFIDPEFSNICDLVKHILSSDNQDEIIASTPIPANIIRHPQSKMLPVIGKPAIYVRESYDDLYHIITNKASKGSKYKFLVTGTSGIGKSCFLIYILIRLLCEIKNVTVIFQPLQSKLFYCFRDSDLSCGSYDDFSTYLHSSETWYLADGILKPKLVPAKTVVALSPKGTVKEGFQEFDKDFVVKFYMPPWSLDELVLCRQHVFPELSEEIMLALYERAGGVPRYVFRRADISLQYNFEKDEIVKKSLERVESALLQVENFDELILCFTENANFIQYSSRLIHRWPDDGSYETYHLRWASRYIYNEIERKLEKQSRNNLLEKILKFEGSDFKFTESDFKFGSSSGSSSGPSSKVESGSHEVVKTKSGVSRVDLSTIPESESSSKKRSKRKKKKIKLVSCKVYLECKTHAQQ